MKHKIQNKQIKKYGKFEIKYSRGWGVWGGRDYAFGHFRMNVVAYMNSVSFLLILSAPVGTLMSKGSDILHETLSKKRE